MIHIALGVAGGIVLASFFFIAVSWIARHAKEIVVVAAVCLGAYLRDNEIQPFAFIINLVMFIALSCFAIYFFYIMYTKVVGIVGWGRRLWVAHREEL